MCGLMLGQRATDLCGALAIATDVANPLFAVHAKTEFVIGLSVGTFFEGNKTLSLQGLPLGL